MLIFRAKLAIIRGSGLVSRASCLDRFVPSPDAAWS